MQGKKFSPFRCHMSNEKRAPSYLGYLLRIILHSYLGILMKQPVLQWKVSGQVFLDRGSSQRSISSLTFHALGESIQVGPKPRSLEISNRWTDHGLQKPAISPKRAQGVFSFLDSKSRFCSWKNLQMTYQFWVYFCPRTCRCCFSQRVPWTTTRCVVSWMTQVHSAPTYWVLSRVCWVYVLTF